MSHECTKNIYIKVCPTVSYANCMIPHVIEKNHAFLIKPSALIVNQNDIYLLSTACFIFVSQHV